ncbi:O34 family O-antigen flippase [Escherichia coli]|uniref:O34 family O-antigen flippase n=1 Tax=Escherichia coli TaxID=562 RepID=UPI000BE53A23|nr:O34 family O-antigen flippase [Escherichia coli]EEZ6201750.1 O34 family O-antigen flippase [Escherichia coli O8]MCC7827345.1 O34 family O-antigen flippase [Escherichia coli]MED0577500.1 O34 family O-antigen flippase [Escherichia coli]NNT82970.1 O34 family O-antigen flippase [Escherichia coli]WGC36739.1 O34 family O-antigen flippase [Escherichia coli]
MKFINLDKRLTSNIISLCLVQGAGYIIPLLTLPYLVKTLGPVSYGVLGFSIAFTQYFLLIVDYGFNLSATKKIAGERNKIKVSEIFWNVMACKLILTIICCVILFTLLEFSSYLYSQKSVIYSSFLIVISSVVFPVWLFQGKECLTLSSLISIGIKLLAVPLIFIYVERPSDAWLAAMITSITSILGGVASLIIIWKRKWIGMIDISLKSIVFELKDAWHVFLSSAAVNLYTSSVTVILGFICGPVAVGYFVAADKLRQAVQGLIIPFSQAFYPRITSLYIKNKKNAVGLIRKLLLLQSMGTLFLSLILFIIGRQSIDYLYGEEYINSYFVLIIFSFCPFLIGVSNVLGIQTMLVMGYKREFSKILIRSGIIGLLLVFPFSFAWGEYGAALVIVISELTVTICMIKFVTKKKLLSVEG